MCAYNYADTHRSAAAGAAAGNGASKSPAKAAAPAAAGLLQMPGPAKGQVEQQFTQARVQNGLYLVYIYVDYFDRYKRLYLFIYVHIIMQIHTDIKVYIRLYFQQI